MRLKSIPIANETIRQAVEKYDKRLPALKELRNITEHYDDYLLKQGRDRTIVLESIRSGILTKYISTENIKWMEYVINLNECMTVAEELFLEIKTVRKAGFHIFWNEPYRTFLMGIESKARGVRYRNPLARDNVMVTTQYQQGVHTKHEIIDE